MTRLSNGLPAWLQEVERLDAAIYAGVMATPTPTLDRVMRALATAADCSRLWIGTSVVLVATCGPRGRGAVRAGLASVLVSSAVVNLLVKPIGRRRRPNREIFETAPERLVPMPSSTSFPSGHAASAFAFATGVGTVMPRESLALWPLALLVAYSRVHAGVHFPGDVIAGSAIGSALARVTSSAMASSVDAPR